MKFNIFKTKVKQYPMFHSKIFPHLTDDVPTLRRQVSEWTKKGYLLQLKRGLYCLREEDRQENFSRFFLANQLYSPSYISLESALSYYNMIPEAVHTVTSVSPKKTQRFENACGLFRYYHIKNEIYSDYVSVEDEFGLHFFIASKERALIDFLYFKTRGLKNIEASIFTEDFRLQNLDDIDPEKLLRITGMFSQKKLLQLVLLLIEQRE